MAGSRDSRSSLSTDLHRLIERYTPDGAGGRLLFAFVSGSISGFFVWMSLVVFFVASGLFWALGTLLLGTIGLGTGLLTVVVLWPIYLAAIGHVENSRDYPKSTASGFSGELTGVDDTDDIDEDEEDPLAILKRRYAAGELSEAAFEHRVDRLLEADTRNADRTDRRESETVLDELERT